MFATTTPDRAARVAALVAAAPSADNRGMLRVGRVLPEGTIEARSLTAYRIDGVWVSFDAIHGVPAMAEPLVVLG